MPRRSDIALLISGAAFALAALIYGLSFHVDAARDLDASALAGFARFGETRVESLTDPVAHLINEGPYVIWTGLLLAWALFTRGARVAVVAGSILLLSNVTTQILKPLLAAPRPSSALPPGAVEAASWPSGHATAAMALALCAVLVAPAARRPLVAAIGALLAMAVGWSVLVGTWHFPSDVLGGYCVAAGWTAAGIAVLWTRRTAPRPVERHAILPPAAVAAAGLVGVAALVAMARPLRTIQYLETSTSAVAVAVVIASTALVLAAGLAAFLRAR
jgi:membrane-associated phospholipid phosphatase